MITQAIQNVTLTLMRGNIVDISADVIVNAANSALAGGGGVDGAIHRAAGPSVMQECHKFERCPTGSAVVTSAGQLKAQYIFHAVGPIYGHHADAAQLLASAYDTCLDLAEKYRMQSIAFPSLSTGAYGYPLTEAAPIALQTVIEHLTQEATTLRQVTFVLFDERTFQAYARALERLLPSM
ncbi:macro domain-containing protein [Ktedonobacter sp. SOSP1-85]|uniref:O-acetyl-ADP-ribose deacetylase n=1 Tax=Ktedonobacter sp. SOSP1-85 TaxID=2778367 RepID=UPI001916951F|nr:O-acetyl-ADP-ribose deacetylase [Ktedonobacter sp. SOSP1-85]GHO75462.1 macro domain-containing protein [Ktedonobacter sp. SOSP1-85]